MNQELVIGPSLIDYLKENYREGDFRSEGQYFYKDFRMIAYAWMMIEHWMISLSKKFMKMEMI